MDAAAWIGWMLVKIPVEAALRRVDIAGARYDGHKGVPLTVSLRSAAEADKGRWTKGPGTRDADKGT